MPPSFSFFSIRSYTILVLVDSDLNMIQGDLLHMDWSTTTTNTNSFNGGFMPTRQPSPPALPRDDEFIQSQLSWHLIMPLPSVMMQIGLQVLQIHPRIYQAFEDHGQYQYQYQYRRIARLAIQAHWRRLHHRSASNIHLIAITHSAKPSNFKLYNRILI
ncbi:hypothetical protein BYT27DRAFT_7215128 [Phlegmacium glaucopus]|nr:hypothetical protein BYT27DRAFT_7215128 [Phlegmacium glaucopus]